MKSILVTLLLIITYQINAQDKTLTFPPVKDSVNGSDSIQKLDFNTEIKGKVIVHASNDLDEITEFVSKNKETIENERIVGFRIQIYFNENKSAALGQKAGFLSSYGEHKAYLDYMAPNYRVRVGNFRTKLEAEKLKQELLSRYPTCIVIKDMIELPELKTDENQTTN